MRTPQCLATGDEQGAAGAGRGGAAGGAELDRGHVQQKCCCSATACICALTQRFQTALPQETNRALRARAEAGRLAALSFGEGVPSRVTSLLPRLIVVPPESAFPGFGDFVPLPDLDHIQVFSHQVTSCCFLTNVRCGHLFTEPPELAFPGSNDVTHYRIVKLHVLAEGLSQAVTESLYLESFRSIH